MGTGARYVTGRIAAQQNTAEIPAACLRANIEFIRNHGTGIAAVNQIARIVRARDPTLDQAAGGSHRGELIPQDIESILRKGQDDGEFRAFDTHTDAWAIRGVLDRVAQRRTLDPAPDEACIAELTTVFATATASRVNT